MNATVQQTLESILVGDPHAHGHLAVFPLLAPQERAPDYVTLADALARELARVTEVSQGGAVPELLLENPSDVKILLLDGDELVGARQNRVLNVTILVGPRTRTKIPVSCVERGRWSYVSREFRSEDRMMYARGRASKMAQVTDSLRRSGTRDSDQGAVWAGVSAKAAAFHAPAPSEAMRDVYAHVERELGAYRRAFRTVARQQVGAVFAIDGHAVGLELCDAPDTFRATLGKLVASYALDAIESRRSVEAVPTTEVARDLVRRAASLRSADVPAVGEGTEVRLEGPGLAGLALVSDDRVVHLSVLEHRTAGGEEPRQEPGDGRPGSLRRRRVAW